MSDTINISLTEENGILYLIMDAPNNNMMTTAFLNTFEAMMEQVAERAEKGGIRGMIIRGGGRHFSSGADVGALAERSEKDAYDDASDELPAGHVLQKVGLCALNPRGEGNGARLLSQYLS